MYGRDFITVILSEAKDLNRSTACNFDRLRLFASRPGRDAQNDTIAG
jgi:hypothetical protein